MCDFIFSYSSIEDVIRIIKGNSSLEIPEGATFMSLVFSNDREKDLELIHENLSVSYYSDSDEYEIEGFIFDATDLEDLCMTYADIA